MTKQEFLSRLQSALQGLPKAEADERIAFYGEMIDDRMEDGMTEQQAVDAVGELDRIVAQTVVATPLVTLAKERIKPKRRLTAWEITLLILGASVWLSLLIAVAAVAVSLYCSVWAVLISLWAVFASVIGCALGCGVAAVVIALNGNSLVSMALTGGAMMCAGLGIFCFFGCKTATNAVLRLTKTAVLYAKRRVSNRIRTLMKKECAQ